MTSDAQVAALRKKIRGEPLTSEEETLLATRKPDPGRPTTPQSRIDEMLEERRRREG